MFLYTKGDGFKDVDNNTWEDIIDPRLQASYEEYEKNKREAQEFSSRIKKFATLKKNTFNLVSLIHKFNLKGPHYDESKFDDYTKWMRVYEKEISIAIDNKDAEAGNPIDLSSKTSPERQRRNSFGRIFSSK